MSPRVTLLAFGTLLLRLPGMDKHVLIPPRNRHVTIHRRQPLSEKVSHIPGTEYREFRHRTEQDQIISQATSKASSFSTGRCAGCWADWSDWLGGAAAEGGSSATSSKATGTWVSKLSMQRSWARVELASARVVELASARVVELASTMVVEPGRAALGPDSSSCFRNCFKYSNFALKA